MAVTTHGVHIPGTNYEELPKGFPTPCPGASACPDCKKEIETYLRIGKIIDNED